MLRLRTRHELYALVFRPWHPCVAHIKRTSLGHVYSQFQMPEQQNVSGFSKATQSSGHKSRFTFKWFLPHLIKHLPCPNILGWSEEEYYQHYVIAMICSFLWTKVKVIHHSVTAIVAYSATTLRSTLLPNNILRTCTYWTIRLKIISITLTG